MICDNPQELCIVKVLDDPKHEYFIAGRGKTPEQALTDGKDYDGCLASAFETEVNGEKIYVKLCRIYEVTTNR